MKTTDRDRKAALVRDFARWVAYCSVSGVGDEGEIYAALDRVDFSPLFDRERGRVSAAEFAAWHRTATERASRASANLNVGYAAKMINEYLKTRCYVAGCGRDGLADVIHPPIDDGLTAGLRNKLSARAELMDDLARVPSMERMDGYGDYETLIRVCERAARIAGCSLMESELFWDGVDFW